MIVIVLRESHGLDTIAPMPRYVFSQSTIQAYEQYDLTLADDGTFNFGVAFSDPAGAAGGYDVSGRWTRAGDTISFEPLERSSPYAGAPSSATVRGDQLDVAGFGAFWLDGR
jgi:hypothetical protein